MIDIHCHLLPGVDDGPKSMDEALEMARLAVKNGITHAVITPHITPGRYDNTLESLSAVYQQLLQALNIHKISLHTALSAEVRLDTVIISMVESGTLPFLGDYEGKKLMLLEFDYGGIPPGALELAQWLVQRRIIPVIAHPERHRSMINNIKILEPYLKAGCLVQITAGSLAGIFGDAPMKTAIKFLEQRWVTVIASDAHNTGLRPPHIEPGRIVAERVLGEQESWALVRDRPAQMTECWFHDQK